MNLLDMKRKYNGLAVIIKPTKKQDQEMKQLHKEITELQKAKGSRIDYEITTKQRGKIMKERHSDLKLWAYKKHFQELELKTLTKRKRALTNLKNANLELKRIRKNLKELKDQEKTN